MNISKLIALNAIILNTKAGGLGVYLNNMIKHCINNSYKRIRVFVNYDFNTTLKENEQLRKIKISNDPRIRIIVENFVWKDIIKKNNISLFHSPISYTPLGVNIPSVITIHDLGFYHYPENYTTLRQWFLEKMIKNSAEKAEKIIAVSEFTKKDIIETLGIENEKIRVIHEGIDVNKFSDEFDDGILSKFEQSMNSFSPFILSVGHLEPRKNYVRLIQAYELLKRKYKIKHKLVIVGQKNWKFQKIYEEVDKLKLRSDVVFTNFVDIKHLVFLYQRADLFVTASTYEGFGFTPLESMAAGTPVAVSNCTSLPEIVGDAALLFNPFDPDDIAEKMYTILMDENTRTRLVKKGKENINRFSWNRCCEETVKLYDEVLDEIG